jgi:hypothetical protein
MRLPWRKRRNFFGIDPFRPRDEFDVDVQPDTLRGKALALMDETAKAQSQIKRAISALPWYRRWPTRVLFWLAGGR